MSNRTILITTSSFNPVNISAAVQLDSEIIYNPYCRKLTEQELAELIESYDPVGIIAGVESYSASTLLAAKSLVVLSRCGVGLDNIDLAAAEQNGIAVEVTPIAPMRAVKELTIAFMFDSLRRISSTSELLKRGEWSREKGNLLSEQTVGIIGLGRIGTEVAKFLIGYGCQVVAYDSRVVEKVDGVQYVSLEQLATISDIITIHVPSTVETHNLINKRLLGLVKKNVVIINTSRGDIVNESDLYDFLIENNKAYACLDTFSEEPYSGPLTKLANTTLTSHIGSFTETTRDQMEREAALNLIKYLPTKNGD